MNPKVDAFLARQERWRGAMEALRRIALDSGLGEELKWGKPCYTFDAANVAIVQGFKEQCALLFFKGALLEDPDGLLEPPGPNSRRGRRMVFAGLADVDAAEDRIRIFLADAIEVERAGLEVEVKRGSEALPAELEAAFAEVDGLETAFRSLTPGRQRGYVLHFTGAKRSGTRRARVERCVQKILDGKGLRD